MWIKIVKEFKPLSSNVHSLKDKEKKRRKGGGGEPHTRTHIHTPTQYQDDTKRKIKTN